MDLLVKLYELPDTDETLKRLAGSGIEIRRAMAQEKSAVLQWVGRWFPYWRDECEVAFANRPVSCYIAVENDRVVGFGCHDATCKNYFGPTAVHDSQRGRGIGKGLLMACLRAMRDNGYGYAIIGGAGPADFYRKTVGAIEIEGSHPGIYPKNLSVE